ncbi:Uncharcterized protein, DUF927 family [Roseivivax halotolerans]|uniref:Uncharcterized protein, DUF927 family n=1 Tax=Roseivivax halotolerans TaxID=93684 RepID=A0A1I6A231_9RHOB|nr:DUF927 domain-containing protein [Roseivivax halotolerans]SFQ62786.1 Uncharcterized protein, DUF927 family [Roseivivax halotolerans]
MIDTTVRAPIPLIHELSPDATRVVPMPTDTALPDLSRDASCVATYTYRDATGGIVGLVARYERSDPKTTKGMSKFYRQVTLWRDPERGLVFAWRGMGPNRPLYRLTDLLARPEASVIISEGEACADAVAAAFSQNVSVSWSGGSNAVSKTDWSPLAGRDVILVPDHDDAGKKAIDAIEDILRNARGTRIRRLDIARIGSAVSGDTPPGYDIADAIADGLDGRALRAMIEEQRDLLTEVDLPAETPAGPDAAADEAAADGTNPIETYLQDTWQTGLTLPDGFSIDKTGIYKLIISAKGELQKEFAGSPMLVVGRTRTGRAGAGWGYLVVVMTPLGDWEILVVPGRLLAGDGREFRELLAELGCVCPQSRAGRQALAEYVGHAQTSEIVEVVTQPGWHGDSYCFPDRVIQPSGSTRRLILDLGEMDHKMSCHGDPEAWQRLAALAVGNSRLAFALSVAFSGYLLELLGEENAVIHIYGLSSRGKTTIIYVAGSVAGGGGQSGNTHTWHATTNGLEGIAALHNDNVLVLDEIKQVAPDELGDVIYMLGNGSGKARADKTGKARPAHGWRVLALSSGEVKIGQHMASGKLGARGRLLGGVTARALDVPIETMPGSGRTYENLHGFESEAALSDHLAREAARSYGHAGPAFVEHLVEDRDAAVAIARQMVDRFVAQVRREDDDAQVSRVARRFGTVAAAGSLATSYGVVPWQRDTAYEAALACYEAWRRERGTNASEDETDAIRLLQRYFESHGGSRFETISSPRGSTKASEDEIPTRLEDRPVHARCGYRAFLPGPDGNAHTTYYVTPEAWRTEICDGRDAEFVARVARKYGALIPGESGRLQKKQRLPDYPGGTRVYAIQPDKLP